ncbi:MAG: hypothetical protein KC438_10050 [Thermomicrobiales bacterium]|nr:hypothetical protein [Thermomicrobiales bacterium]
MARSAAKRIASGVNSFPHRYSSLTQFNGEGCSLFISGVVQFGPNAGQTFQGTLTFSIGQDGAIESGTLQFSDGTTAPVVGQATGRSIRLRVGSAPNSTITFTGSGVFPIDQCSGDFGGAFVGTGLQNIGVWNATQA